MKKEKRNTDTNSKESMDDLIVKSPKASLYIGILLGSLFGLTGNIFVSALFDDWAYDMYIFLVLVISGISILFSSIVLWKLTLRSAREDSKKEGDKN